LVHGFDLGSVIEFVSVTIEGRRGRATSILGRPTDAAMAHQRSTARAWESRPSGLQAEQVEGELFSLFFFFLFFICLFSKTFFK
jgi:hypothetical protein